MIRIDRDWPEDQVYGTPEPTGTPRWAAVELWEQSNPNPGAGPDFDDWYSALKLVSDRTWIYYIFPNLHVWDWDDEDVRIFRKWMSRHVCRVCGRIDDVGCMKGC